MSKLEQLKQNLSQRERETLFIEDFRPAAILVPLLQTASSLELLFTVRSPHLRSHAGQIAFPGGGLDPHESIISAASRESFEEIGLLVKEENILGFLDDHPSPAKYIVTPVLAVIDWPQTLSINTQEVSEVFTVPLATLLELKPRSEQRQLKHYQRHLHFYDYQHHSIWGLTGNVVKNFLDIWRSLEISK